MDALSDVKIWHQALTDMPIPVVSTGQKHTSTKRSPTAYISAAPRGTVPQSLHGYTAGPGPHVRLAVLPLACPRFSALGLQLLAEARTGCHDRSVHRRHGGPVAGHSVRRSVRGLSPDRTARWTPSGGRCLRNRWKTTRCCRPPELILTMRCWKIFGRMPSFPRPRRGS